MGDEIGRTDFIKKHCAVSVFAAMRHPGHRVAGVLVDDCGKFFGDFLERLVPGDRLEFSVGAAFHRLSHPVLVIEVGGNAMSTGAQSAVILHSNRMPFDFPESPVFDVGEHWAAGRAAVAIAGDFTNRRIGDRSAESLNIQELRGGDSYCGRTGRCL